MAYPSLHLHRRHEIIIYQYRKLSGKIDELTSKITKLEAQVAVMRGTPA